MDRRFSEEELGRENPGYRLFNVQASVLAQKSRYELRAPCLSPDGPFQVIITCSGGSAPIVGLRSTAVRQAQCQSDTLHGAPGD